MNNGNNNAPININNNKTFITRMVIVTIFLVIIGTFVIQGIKIFKGINFAIEKYSEQETVQNNPQTTVTKLPEIETDESFFGSENRYLVYTNFVNCQTDGNTSCDYTDIIFIDQAKKCYSHTYGFKGSETYYGKYTLTKESLTLKSLIHASGSDSGYEFHNKEKVFKFDANGNLEYQLTDSEKEEYNRIITTFEIKNMDIKDNKLLLTKSNLKDSGLVAENDIDSDDMYYGYNGWNLCGLE